MVDGRERCRCDCVVIISSVLLSWYLSNFANYDATYGSLGAAIGLMMWLWISSIVIWSAQN